MPYSAFLAALMIGGALLAAPLSPAFAGRDDRAASSYDGERDHARRSSKMDRQDRAYRQAQRERRARLAAQRERRLRARYDNSPWGPFDGPPGLF